MNATQPRPRRCPSRRPALASWLLAVGAWWLAGAAGALAAGEPIERLENEARAKPDTVADELDRLLTGDRTDGPIVGLARLDAEHLRGFLRARLHQPAAAEAVARGLQKTDAPGFGGVPREQLAAVATCIRAAVALSDGGSLVRADEQLAEVEASLRAVPLPAVRMRCLSTLAAIRQRIGRIEDAVRLSQEVIHLADESGAAWRRSAYRSALAYSLFRGGQLEHAGRINEEAKKVATEVES